MSFRILKCPDGIKIKADCHVNSTCLVVISTKREEKTDNIHDVKVEKFIQKILIYRSRVSNDQIKTDMLL